MGTCNMSMFTFFLLVFPCCQVLCQIPGPSYRTVNFTDPEHGVVERSFIQYLPESYNGDFAVPLVLDFHGWTSSAQTQMETESMVYRTLPLGGDLGTSMTRQGPM